MRLVWAPHALEQLEEAVFYIAQDDPAAALRVHQRVVESCDHLAQFPSIGKEGMEPGTRELVISNTPYVVTYRVQGDQIDLLAVWHGAQSRSR